ncbi:hypothetical protein ACMFMF_001704 [Clarireedia jacksonii]
MGLGGQGGGGNCGGEKAPENHEWKGWMLLEGNSSYVSLTGTIWGLDGSIGWVFDVGKGDGQMKMDGESVLVVLYVDHDVMGGCMMQCSVVCVCTGTWLLVPVPYKGR